MLQHISLAERRELLQGSFDHYTEIDHLFVVEADNMPFLPQDEHLARLHAQSKASTVIQVPRVLPEAAALAPATGPANGGECGDAGAKKPDPAAYDRMLSKADRKLVATALKLPADATDVVINTRLIELGLPLEISTEDILKAVK